MVILVIQPNMKRHEYVYELARFARSEICTGVCSVSHVQLSQILLGYFRFRRIVSATHDQASGDSSCGMMIGIEKLQHTFMAENIFNC